MSILANSKLRDCYKAIQELMEEDLPLTDNAYEIESLFNDFTTDLENSRTLFPAVLQFCGTDEYRAPVMAFCLALRDKGYIRNKSLRSMARQMLINANSEYKRVASRKRKSVEPLPAYQTSNLIDYIAMLYGQASDSKIAAFLDKCRNLAIAEIDNEFLRLDVVEGKHPRAALSSALRNPPQRFIAVQLMVDKKDNSYRSELTDEEIATSAIVGYQTTAPLSADLKQTQTVKYGRHLITFYFFETKSKSPDDDEPIKHLQMVAFVNDGKNIDPAAYLISFPFQDVEDEKRKEKFASLIRETLYGQHQRSFGESSLEVADVIGEY